MAASTDDKTQDRERLMLSLPRSGPAASADRVILLYTAKIVRHYLENPDPGSLHGDPEFEAIVVERASQRS
jgi:hypothetical protein